MTETAYKQVLINPVCMDCIKRAKGKITTIYGEIKVEYDENSVKITVSDGIVAVLKLNGKEIRLNNREENIIYL